MNNRVRIEFDFFGNGEDESKVYKCSMQKAMDYVEKGVKNNCLIIGCSSIELVAKNDSEPGTVVYDIKLDGRVLLQVVLLDLSDSSDKLQD